MRIAFITTMSFSAWGGSEELWADAARIALKERHDVLLSVYCWNKTPTKILELQKEGAQVSQRPNFLFPQPQSILGKVISKSRLLAVKSLGFYLFRKLFDFKPDVICISQGYTYECLNDMPFLIESIQRHSIPYVIVCQFNSDAYHLESFQREAAIDAFKYASQVNFVSENNLKSAERQLAKKLSNAVILQNPVNLSNVASIVWPSTEIIRLASVARLEIAYKGQDILFEALSSKAWQDRQWELSLYGEGPDKKYLQALAEHYQIVDRVHFQGHIKNIREIWASNHLFILPSRAEGTPLALVEAMLCGRPSVVTDVGGNVDWIIEGNTGFIAEAATAKSFGNALERAWQSRSIWRDMGIKAHEFATAKRDISPGKSLLKVILNAAKSK